MVVGRKRAVKRLRSLVLALLPFVATAVEPLTLETAVGGDVRCPGLGVKFTPMQRRVDGSFKGFVANAEAEAGGSLRWTFSPHGGDDQNVVMLKLDAGRWAGGKCTSDAQAVTIPRSHEKGRNIHLSVHESQRFTFTAAGETFSLDFGTTVKLHAMDEREWGFDTFVFRFYGKGDVIAATMASEHPFVAKKREPFVIQRGKRWIPVKIAREIKAGSALDFSWMVDGRDGSTSRPGGRDMALSLPCRRVVARGRHFEFEDFPGVPRRFYGVNLCGSGTIPSPAVGEAFVAQMARRGYNALRLHHHDDGLVQGSPDGTTINQEALGRMEALLAACKRHGLYVTTDLFVSRKVPRRAIGQNRDGVVGMDEYKALVLVNEAAFSNLCAFARQWLTHVNPHTGLRWADDPTLAFLAFVNEGHIGMNGAETLRTYPEYAAAWKTWVATDGCGIAEIPSGKPWDKTPEMEAFARFVASLEMRFAQRMRAFLKDELGVKALLSDMSSGMEREPFRAVRAAHYDYVDEHFYWDHPSFPGVAWRTPVKCRNVNPIKSRGADVLGECSRVGLADKPFVATEYDFPGPNIYRSMAGLVAGAQAAREDWGGVWRFDWGESPWSMTRPDEVRAGLFSLSGDVLARATERAALCLFLRGDLAVGDADAVRADREAGTFTVGTARTAGGFTEDGRLTAGALTAACDKAPTAIWASTLDGEPFAASRRILVTHLTDLRNEGDTFLDDTRTLLLSWGKPPHLMRAGRSQVSLAVGAGAARVYALGTDGARVREVPCRMRDGRLLFTADVSADLASATFLYEIVR